MGEYVVELLDVDVFSYEIGEFVVLNVFEFVDGEGRGGGFFVGERLEDIVDEWRVVEYAVYVCADAVLLLKYSFFGVAHSLVDFISFAYVTVEFEFHLSCGFLFRHGGCDG